MNDAMIHRVDLQCENGQYHLFVDGTRVASGLHSVLDHPNTTVRIGDESGLMKKFRGTITNIMYANNVVPPCLLHTFRGSGHLDRLEPMDPLDANASVFQDNGVDGSGTTSKLVKFARKWVRPEQRDEFDREMGLATRDVEASSSEMRTSAAQDAKKASQWAKERASAVRSAPANIGREVKEDFECTFTHTPWCRCEKYKRVRERKAQQWAP